MVLDRGLVGATRSEDARLADPAASWAGQQNAHEAEAAAQETYGQAYFGPK